MSFVPIDFEPGFFTEQTAVGAKNRWKGGDHVRFRYGLPEKLRGFEQIVGDFLGKARRLHDWISLDQEKWIALGTSKKLYIFSVIEERFYDITPFVAGSLPPFASAPLTDPFDTTASSMTVQVTQVGHNRAVGDAVHFSGASAVGGITIDGEYEVTAVTGQTTYEIEHPVAATSTANGGGTVQWMFELSTVNAQIAGWGGGVWGGGVWSGSQPSSLPQRIRLWSLENWGEDLIANPRDGGIYWWDRTLGPESRATLIENAPTRVRRILLSPQDRHLIAFGADDPLNIMWCAQEDFTNWTPLPINTSGDKRVDAGSELITAIRTRGEIVMYTDLAVLAMDFEGPPFVFGFTERGESLQILSPNAAAEINGIVYFMANSDFMVYDGILRVIPCDVREQVYGNLNLDESDKVYAAVNRLFNEIWWFYPTAGSDEPDEYVIYNYLENCWYTGTLDRTAFHDVSEAYDVPYGASPEGKLWKHDTGVDGGMATTLQPFAEAASPIVGSWLSVAYGEFAGKFVAVSFDETEVQQVMYSEDGETWTGATAASARPWRAVCAAEELELFVAVATPLAGSGNLVMTSPDGETWTTRAESNQANWRNVVWAEDLELLVAVGSGAGGAGSKVMTSPDGITWTGRTEAANTGWFGLVWARELGLLVAVAEGGSVSDSVMTSPDGINWTARTVPEANDWFSVAWSPKLRLLVAVATSGTNRIMTSPNGIDWTAVAAPAANEWRYVMWVGGIDQFVAVARDGDTNRVMYSDDGETWTLASGDPASSSWAWLAWSHSKLKLVAVAWSAAAGGDAMVSYNQTPLASSIESFDAQIGEGDWFMQVGGAIPDFKRLTGSIDLTVRGKKYPTDAAYKTKGPYTILPTTKKLDFRLRARQITVGFDTDAIGDDWRFGTFRVDAGKHGRK